MLPRVTRYSALGAPPEKGGNFLLMPFRLLYAVVASLAVVSIMVALLPFALLRRVWSWLARRPSYHTQPSELKVAVVGGGWSGLQCAARLRELGVRDITASPTTTGPSSTKASSARASAGTWPKSDPSGATAAIPCASSRTASSSTTGAGSRRTTSCSARGVRAESTRSSSSRTASRSISAPNRACSTTSSCRGSRSSPTRRRCGRPAPYR